MNNINSWNDYLASAGAPVLTTDELAKGFVAVVTGQDIIAVTGEDAASFLHGQLTNDVEHLGNAEARLAGYCSPKGRLLASFLMWRNAESVFLQVPSELRAALQKRLSMFVLRAKARLSDVSADTANSVTLGIGGANAAATLQQVLGALPAAHHQLLAHGRAVTALRAAGVDNIGIANNHAPTWAASEKEEDQQAAGLYDAIANWVFADPILLGTYPAELEPFLPAGAQDAASSSPPTAMTMTSRMTSNLSQNV